MTTEIPPSSGAGDPGGPRRRRPAPTIDLRATEIESAPSAAAAAPPSSQEPSPPSEPAVEAAAPSSPPRPESREPSDSEPPAPPHRPAIAWLPPDLPWPTIGAGAAGGAGVLLLFLLIWLLLPARDPMGPLTPRLAAIETQLRELNARPAPPSADPKAVEDLSARLAKIETAAATPRAPAADPALLARLTAVENAMKSLSDNLATLVRRADDNAAAVREARSRADATAGALGELQNAARVSSADHSQLEALTGRIAALERTNRSIADELAKRQAATANDRAVRLAVTAGALRAAVERGDPFTAELAIVKPLAPDASTLAALEPFAASGVPSTAALGRELGGLIAPMLQASGAAKREGGGIMDRLQANAERLVRIRPIDDAPGDDAAAVLARIENRAAHADIGGALAELAKLPPQVRAPAQAWIAKAQARGKAIEAGRKIAADAVAALKTAS